MVCLLIVVVELLSVFSHFRHYNTGRLGTIDMFAVAILSSQLKRRVAVGTTESVSRDTDWVMHIKLLIFRL